MASFQDRVIGALKLQASTFEEVENDTTATTQAAIVVIAAAVSQALGSAIALGFLGVGFGLTGLVIGLILAPIGWVVGSWVLFMVGTKVMPGPNTKADLGQLLRVTGFASAPGLLGILTLVPILGFLVGFVLFIWKLAAMVIGVKQALEYDDYVKPIVVCLIAAVVIWVISAAVAVMGMFGAGVGSRFM